MTRTFHPIGQGAFYTEKFDDGFTVVYDCGGSNKAIIKNEINNTFKKGEKIDMVFISHFHNDHINGLEFLIEYCDIKKLVLPLLSNDIKFQLTIERYARHQNSKFYDAIINNPSEVFDEERLVFVDFDDNPNNNILDVENLKGQIQSGVKIQYSKYNWIYVPYNLNYNKYAKQIQAELKTKNITTSSELLGSLAKDKQEIIDIYKRVLGGAKNFNINSLVVYSGSSEQTDKIGLVVQSFNIIMLKKLGVLYMGDFNAKEDFNMKKIKDKFSLYWDDIGIVQIPHHGSKHNYHIELSWKSSASLISSGFKYSHPSQEVLNNIESIDSNILLVSSIKESEAKQYILDENFAEKCLIKYIVNSSTIISNVLKEKCHEYFI